ncbi:MAG: hypothetical protein A3F68_08550 [Acidobacteria bacterium RIFCSPLOWO2_12_FULL_54_10]|nr:MAG: hypothetical protein A3F68_08550 [Acidobacteria bacterium RIFCSPLOWO2_12_FULL_54_10]
MKLEIYLLALTVLAVGALRAQAQGPLHDQVTVNLPFHVRVGDKILEPSRYAIRQVSGTVLQIVKNPDDPKNMRVEAAMFTIPTESARASGETKVVLRRFDRRLYLDQVWVQGKGSGYEFPLPENVKALERERRVTASVYYPYVPWSADRSTDDHVE